MSSAIRRISSQRFANGKSEFVGIIVPNLYLHYYSEMLTQLLATYTDYHYKFLIFMSDKGRLRKKTTLMNF